MKSWLAFGLLLSCFNLSAQDFSMPVDYTESSDSVETQSKKSPASIEEKQAPAEEEIRAEELGPEAELEKLKESEAYFAGLYGRIQEQIKVVNGLIRQLEDQRKETSDEEKLAEIKRVYEEATVFLWEMFETSERLKTQLEVTRRKIAELEAKLSIGRSRREIRHEIQHAISSELEQKELKHEKETEILESAPELKALKNKVKAI